MNLELKHAYLIQAYVKTYDELLFRIRNRDNWIKTQLICQLVLIAIASGLKLQIVNSDSPLPNALSFSLPVSFVIFLLYQIEETIITLLSRYLGEMSKAEEAMNSGFFVHNFDSSVAVGSFWTRSQKLKTASVSIVFLLIPLSLWLYRARSMVKDWYFAVEAGVSCLLMVFITWSIVNAHNARRQNAKSISKWLSYLERGRSGDRS